MIFSITDQLQYQMPMLLIGDLWQREISIATASLPLHGGVSRKMGPKDRKHLLKTRS